jgi:Ca2+-binding EF-hand superfamily protein
MSQLLRMYDDSGDGRITFDEFVEIVADLGFHGNYEGTGLRTSNIE